MPHMCDECGYTFPSASNAMLDGCPDCGGNRFQYVAEGEDATPTGAAAADAGPTAADDPDATPEETTDDSAIIDADPSSENVRTQSEDSAQQAARGDIIEPEETDVEYSGSMSDLVSGLQSKFGSDDPDDDAESPAADEPVSGVGAEESTTESPAEAADDAPGVSANSSRRVSDTDALRQELMDQFESIKILEPGSYELNLRKLYEREEHIIQIQEDGKYVIQMPER